MHASWALDASVIWVSARTQRSPGARFHLSADCGQTRKMAAPEGWLVHPFAFLLRNRLCLQFRQNRLLLIVVRRARKPICGSHHNENTVEETRSTGELAVQDVATGPRGRLALIAKQLPIWFARNHVRALAQRGRDAATFGHSILLSGHARRWTGLRRVVYSDLHVSGRPRVKAQGFTGPFPLPPDAGQPAVAAAGCR